MSWIDAIMRGLAVVAYFVILTVWLPDLVLQLDAVAGASAWVRDVVVLAIWGGALVGGMVLMRMAQSRKLI